MPAEGSFVRRGGYTFREADEQDFESIEELFARHNYIRKSDGWARWKYRDNPDGPARIFVVEDPDDSIVGVLGYSPRRFTSAETGVFVVMRVIDIFVEAEQRARGVFLPLLEFARGHMNVPKMGVPNIISSVFAVEPGWHDLPPYESWKFPVLIGNLYESKLVAGLANAFARVYASLRLSVRPRNLEMRPVERFQSDYGAMTGVIHGVRSAEYLNWRFVDNPLREYSSYEFLEGDESVGYCVYARDESSAILADFATRRRHKSCLRLVVDHCRENGFARVIFTGVGLHARKLGFIKRGSSTIKAFDVPRGRWMITVCDTDTEG